MQMPAILFDIICLFIIVMCALFFARRGILAGLLSLLGTVISMVGATLISRAGALPAFNRFFRPNLEESISGALGEQSAMAKDMMLEDITGFLPENMQESFLNSVSGTELDTGMLAGKIVTEMVQPLVLPIITLALFIAVFVVLRGLIGALLRILRTVRGIPYIGTVQRAFGAVAGVAFGTLNVFLLVAILAAAMTVVPEQMGTLKPLQESLFYGVFSNTGWSPVGGLLAQISTLN